MTIENENTQPFSMADYQQLHQAVLDYQGGSQDAAEVIIQSFDKFLWRYVNLLSAGIFQIDDTGLRRFISLFMNGKGAKSHVNQYKFKLTVRDSIYSTVSLLQLTFSRCPQDELRNELICALLSMALRYRDLERPSFHNYVDKCFHYEAFRALTPYLNDPASRFNNEDLDDWELEDEESSRQFTKTEDLVVHQQALDASSIAIKENISSLYDASILNVNWINGITCGAIFQVLTPFERRLMLLSYSEKKTDTQIAEIYGVCRATINRKKQNAIKKLRGVNSDTRYQ